MLYSCDLLAASCIMDQFIPIVFLLIGLAIGVTAAWLVLRAKGKT